MKWLIIPLIFLLSCQLKVGYKQNYFYTVSDKHQFRPYRTMQICPRQLEFRAMFKENCIYDLGNSNQADINKLYGITSARIHKNSARIGWRSEQDSTIGIFAYWYIDGDRDYQRLGETNPNVLDNYYVSVKDNKYVFKFNDAYLEVEGVDKDFWINSYRTYPWFGGQELPPHFMEIIIIE